MLSKGAINKIVSLRETGHSVSEIYKITKNGKATISKYIKNVQISSPYDVILREKQGGSKTRSQKEWKKSVLIARQILKKIKERDKFLILACLYWGEGNKREFDLINSDPSLIKVVISCLSVLNVNPDSLRISIRIYEDLDKDKVLDFWSNITGVPKNKIINIDVLKGKKAGKLNYGMCRVRIAKSAKYFKIIMSMVDLIKRELNAAVVQRIERGFPKP